MIVDLDAGHHRLMADAAPRIFVDLCDQRLDRPPPVPDDVGRLALSYRDDPAANHEDAIVTAFVLLLDNDLSAVHRSLFETPPNLLGRAQVEADPPAATASSAVRTRAPFGVATPISVSRRLVRFLSPAVSTATSEVWPVMLARMRCWFAPQPSWTRLWSLRRISGIPRRRASSTSDCVVGPSRPRVTSSRSSSTAAFRSNGSSSALGAGATRFSPSTLCSSRGSRWFTKANANRPANRPASSDW